ncbi:AsnC family transcriptional regulator [Amycolatopsis sp. NPDC051903]|uniref:AsnC family transcriptional regulator n=1 Tax=Amycolatopsis sp. NPDC051903 TaxID=3363936 RepID=UPI00379E028F
MHERTSLGELDLSILHALQIAPLAPWQAIADVLRVDHTTVARRWARMEQAGLSWLVGYYPRRDRLCRAAVSVRCRAADTWRLAAEIAADTHANSVDVVDGDADLALRVGAVDLEQLAGYVNGRLARLPGVRDVRTTVITRRFEDGRRWRLDALTREQAARLTALHPDPVGDGAPFGPEEWSMLAVLGPRPRCSANELAERTGTSAATARRRRRRMMRDGTLQVRCEVAGPAAGWPVQVSFTAGCPAEHLARAAAAICALPSTRSCEATTGSSNVHVVSWVRDVADVPLLELTLSACAPGFVVTERSVVLAPVKRFGRLLDRAGRRVAYVPMNVWTNRPELGRFPHAPTPVAN